MANELNLPNASHLAWLAAMVAVEAPERVSANAVCASIPWETVTEIREALDAAGFDWRKTVKERVRLEKVAKAEWQAKHYPTNPTEGEMK
jgi:hypothetical protein